MEEGLELDEVAEIEAATQKSAELAAFARGALGVEDRIFFRAVATWIARLDGPTGDEEAAALAALGARLGRPNRPRTQAEAVAEAPGR